MSALLSTVDPDGLLEYSVVYTDRSLNHMSKAFQQVMKGISSSMKAVYNAAAVAVVSGGGTYGMEAVARQFATDKKCLVIRNGLFSYRWSQILDAGQIPSGQIVMKAGRIGSLKESPFAPAPVEEVLDTIRKEKPAVVFAPHVETSAGMMLPDRYISSVAEAVHQVGGLMVLDCIASGAMWVDMEQNGIDVLLSAPQKGWSSSPCCALVMFSARALDQMESTTSSSFACDLKKWRHIMQAYEQGGHAYHATLPTDGLAAFYKTVCEAQHYGLETLRIQQQEIGNNIRGVLTGRGFKSVAAEEYQAPSVIVSYTDNPEIQNGQQFSEAGVQIASGVPLFCDEPESFMSFRVGLFGLDKLENPRRTAALFENALEYMMKK
ncbi:Serine-pyruvate aminotransferase [invertebrate metagenome]|uniref:Serine-pyruvate aminotransferase n=1 Tax=invertebrate metagenome TaxID=1711999 RepID=A0A2H9T8I0_9ZZZZ